MIIHEHYASYLDIAMKDGTITQKIVWTGVFTYWSQKLSILSKLPMDHCSKMLRKKMDEFPDASLDRIFKKCRRDYFKAKDK